MIPDFGFYNMDCMEGMKQFPDKYFELAIVDPPYGDGGASGNDKTRAGSEGRSTVIDHLHSSQRKRERERERRSREQAERGRASSAKKSFRGMLPRSRNISMNCFASHGTKLFGGATIFTYRRQDAFSCGKSTFPKISRWQCVSMRGLHSMQMQKCLNIRQ